MFLITEVNSTVTSLCDYRHRHLHLQSTQANPVIKGVVFVP